MTPEFSDTTPDMPLFVAITQKIDENWHTYWKNPGDSGEPPAFSWTLPAGIKPVKTLWPVPKAIPAGPLTNLGYEGEVTILQQFEVSPELPEGALEIKAGIDVLVCEEICIPEYHEASFMLNEGKDETNSEIITEAYNHMPVDVDWDATYYTEDDDFIIHMNFEKPAFITRGDKSATFDIMPYEWGIVEYSDNTRVKLDKQDNFFYLTLRKKLGERPLKDLGNLKTLIAFEVAEDNHFGALEIEIEPDEQWLAALQKEEAEKTAKSKSLKKNSLVSSENSETPLPQTGFLKALLLAVLGGLVLNLMPCVFPILSMKALSLVKMSEKSQAAAKLHGIAYTIGVMASFGLIAATLIALRSAGAQIGWGFQLQNPVVIILIAYLLFAVGLNLSGFFEISGRFTNIGSKLGEKQGVTGSFFTGILATIVATPCTAPFMGVALGYAITQPPLTSMIVFLALGFGLALPYLLLSFIPALRAFLPKPGNWMVVFRQLLAFPIYASAAWLIWVFSQQADTLALLYALIGFSVITLSIWIFKVTNKTFWRFLAFVILVGFLALIVTESLKGKPQITSTNAAQESAWARPFSEQSYTDALQTDQPVFVNMTAAWCITCKVNERVALEIESTHALFKDKNVIYLKGDWTNQDPDITKYLSRYGRNGVPIYVFYGAPEKADSKRPEPVVLPQILTPGILAGQF